MLKLSIGTAGKYWPVVTYRLQPSLPSLPPSSPAHFLMLWLLAVVPPRGRIIHRTPDSAMLFPGSVLLKTFSLSWKISAPPHPHFHLSCGSTNELPPFLQCSELLFACPHLLVRAELNSPLLGSPVPCFLFCPGSHQHLISAVFVYGFVSLLDCEQLEGQGCP